MKTAKLNTVQEKKVNAAAQAVADAIMEIEDDISNYSDDRELINDNMYATIMDDWVPTSENVQGMYEDAFDILSNNTAVTNAGGWGTLKVNNNDAVVSAWKDAYTADVASGETIKSDLIAYDKAIKQAQKDNFNATSIKTKITAADMAIQDAIDSIMEAQVEDGTTQLNSLTMSVTKKDRKAIAAKIQKLNKKFENFDNKKDVSGQIKKFAKKLDTKNGISKWAKNQKIEQQIQSIVDDIDSKVTVTMAAQEIPVVENITLEASILYSTVFVFTFAAILASISNKLVATPSKKDTIEFDIESSEMIKVEASKKENKKVIKKTLANIMKKNNAKTTLIQ